jgi:TPR repeat protein
MPNTIISCALLPPATILSVPIYDFAIAHDEMTREDTEIHYPCCGKNICKGCIYSFCAAGNNGKCPFCNSDRADKTNRDIAEEIMKRAEANDAASIYLLADYYEHGLNGIQQDQTKAIDLYDRAADLGYKKAHNNLACVYHEGGNLKKAKFHWEAAAMLGHELARNNLGCMEAESGNMDRAVKHWTIAATAGDYKAMQKLRLCF